jgi:fibronectin-binding autotransporter adhesin
MPLISTTAASRRSARCGIASRSAHRCVAVVSAWLLACGAVVAVAQSPQTWNGAGNQTSWSTTSGTANQNFSGAVWTQGNDAVFGAAIPNPAITLAQSTTANSLAFSTGTTFSIGGAQSLTLSATTGGLGIVRSATTSGTQTLSMSSLVLGSTQTWQIDGGGRLVASAPVSGAFGLTKTGTGLLQLSGTNTFSGGFTLSSGSVVMSSTSALGTGPLVLGGGTLDIATAGGDVAYDTTVTANATILSNRPTSGAGINHTLGTLSIGPSVLSIGRGAAATSGTGGITFGATTLTGNATFNTAANSLLTLGSLADGGIARTITKSGTGGLVLAAAAGGLSAGTVVNVSAGSLSLADATALGSGVTGITMTGGTVALGAPTTLASLTGTAGTVTLGGNALTVNTASTGTFAGIISGSGSLTKTGTGTLAMARATTFGVAATVNQGTLAYAAANVFSGSASLAVAGGVLDMRTFTDTVGGFSITSGTLAGTGTLTAPTYALGGGSIVANLGSGTVSVTANTSLVGRSAATVVAVSSGTLTLGSAARFSASPAVTGSAGTAILLSGSETFGSLAGAGSLVIGGGTLTTGGNHTTTIWSGVISGAGGLTKSGSGGFTLSGANSYGGTTRVTSGTLTLGNPSAISGSTAIVVAGGVFNLASFSGSVPSVTITGGTLAGSGTLTTAGTYALGGGSVTANLGTGLIRSTGRPTLAGLASTGTVSIASGTLTLASAGRFTASPAVSMSTNTGLLLGGSETIGSLAGTGTVNLGGGTLTTGGSGSSTTFSGTIGGTGGLAKVGSGTFTLSGTSVYSGATNVTGGRLALGRSDALPNSTAVTVTNAGLTLGTFRDTVASLTTGNTGTSTLAFTVASGSSGGLTTTGNVAFGSGSNVLAFTNVSTGTLGRYDILTYGGTLSGSYGVTGIAGTNYTLQSGGTSNASIFLQRKAQFGAITSTFAGTNAIIAGGTAAFTFTVRNATPTGGANLTVASVTSGSGIVGSVDVSGVNVVPGGTSAPVSGFSFTSTGTGNRTATFTLTNTNAVTATATGTVSVAVYASALPAFTSSTIALAPLHVGYAAPVTATGSAANAAGFRVNLGGSGTTSGLFSLSGLAGVAAGATGTVTGSLAPGQGVGAFSQPVTYRFSDSSTLSGASANVGTGTYTFIGQVYTGTSTWTRTTSGTHSWGTLTGTGAGAFGLNWGTNQGSPGLDAAFTRTDTATFGTALTSGTAVVLLNGANPSLKSITFNNAAGSYDLDIGTGGSGRIILAGSGTTTGVLDVQAGTHQIHTELQLGSDLQVSVAAGSGLTLHAAVSGSAFGLTKSGAGLLTMRGNDVYSGGTLITGGTLAIGSAGALGSGTVTLSGGSTLNLQGFAITNPIDSTGGFVINPASNVVTISGPTVVSGTTITGVYTVTPTGSGTFTGPLGDPVGLLGGQVTVQSGGLVTTTGTITDYGSVLIQSGGRGIFSGPVNGVITSSGTSTFNADLQSLADVTVNGGVATFNGTSYGDVNVDVSGTTTGGATATFNGTIDRTAHVYESGTMNLYGSVTANADVKVEAGGVARMYGSGTFGQGAMLVNGSFVVDRTTDLTMATVFSGTGSLVKQGSGTLTFTGSSSYAGSTYVNAGMLAINGHLGSGTVTVANGATLSGAGVAGMTITGGGEISPGDSPGILTTQNLAPASTTSFALQFTGTGAPDWSNTTASVNDVLRLTDATNPFASSLTSSNIVNVFFDVATLTLYSAFEGGFYADKSADFTSSIAAATYNYYVKGDGMGSDAFYSGEGYYSLPTWAVNNLPTYSNVMVNTKYAQADFSGGTVDGYTSEFVVVPEPAAPIGGMLALAGAAWCLRRRSRRA